MVNHHVKRRANLQTRTISLDISAIKDHVKQDKWTQWKHAGEKLDWLVGAGLHDTSNLPVITNMSVQWKHVEQILDWLVKAGQCPRLKGVQDKLVHDTSLASYRPAIDNKSVQWEQLGQMLDWLVKAGKRLRLKGVHDTLVRDNRLTSIRPAINNQIKQNRLAQWKQVGQISGWLVGAGQHLSLKGMQDTLVQDTRITIYRSTIANNIKQVQLVHWRQIGQVMDWLYGAGLHPKVKWEQGVLIHATSDLPAMANKFILWKQVGQVMDWLYGAGLHLSVKGEQDVLERDNSGTEVVVSGSKLSTYKDDEHIRKHGRNKNKLDKVDLATVDDNNGDTEPTIYHRHPSEYQRLFEEDPKSVHGGHGDSFVHKTHDKYQEKAAQTAPFDDDEEEKIVRVEHIWSSDNDERVEEHDTTVADIAENDSATARANVYDEDDDDDAMFGVLGIYACGQAGVCF